MRRLKLHENCQQNFIVVGIFCALRILLFFLSIFLLHHGVVSSVLEYYESVFIPFSSVSRQKIVRWLTFILFCFFAFAFRLLFDLSILFERFFFYFILNKKKFILSVILFGAKIILIVLTTTSSMEQKKIKTEKRKNNPQKETHEKTIEKKRNTHFSWKILNFHTEIYKNFLAFHRARKIEIFFS